MGKKILAMILASAMVLLAGCSNTGASEYPSRNVTMVVAYKAGGGQYITARALQSSLETALGESVVITNKEGGSGVIGFTYIANSKPDGYTIGMCALSSICINHVFGELEKDPREAYEFLGGVCNEVNAICVSADSEFDSLSDIVEFAKAHPSEITFAVTGATSADSVLAKEIERSAGIDFKEIDFDGASDALASVLGGHVNLMGGTLSEMVTYEQAGQVKIIAVAGDDYGYPTFEEQGVPIGFASIRRAIIAPKGLPDGVREKLVAAIKEAVESEDYIEKATATGQNPEYASPETMAGELDALMEALEAFGDQ